MIIWLLTKAQIKLLRQCIVINQIKWDPNNWIFLRMLVCKIDSSFVTILQVFIDNAELEGIEDIKSMMTSSSGNIFRVSGLLRGEFTGVFPAQRALTRSFDVSFICAWTDSWANNAYAGDLRSYRAHCDAILTLSSTDCQCSHRYHHYWLSRRHITRNTVHGRGSNYPYTLRLRKICQCFAKTFSNATLLIRLLFF